jgi:hypothetical protein
MLYALQAAVQSRADLCGANLSGANLFDADLSGANLSGVNLSCANLSRANLYRANLSGANLCGADLSGANLSHADLCGAKINWQSHDLISELLRREAGDDIDKRMVAGLILVSRDWCWEKFLAINRPLREWAIETLRKWVQPNDGAPEVLRADAVRKEAGE